MDISEEYGPEILYVCALTFGNIQKSVEMSH